MATEFKLPELGENIEAGDVVRIAVTAGETIQEGQTVVELETDKAVVEVPSTVSGVIEKVIVTPSQRVKVGRCAVHLYGDRASRGARTPRQKSLPKKQRLRQQRLTAKEPRAKASGAAGRSRSAGGFAPPR